MRPEGTRDFPTHQDGDNPEERFEICAKRRSILEGTGHMLVIGGPGSGKTTIALLKSHRTVVERLRPEQSVLFLSFSNAAIRRINESGGDLLVPEIRRQVDVKTYHSFAWDILRSHGYLLSTRRSISVIGAHDAAVLRGGLEQTDWAEEEKRLFVEEGRLTYDQFAPLAADLLERSEVARACFCDAYPLILVDEFQDTDEDQWRLVRALSEGSEIIALGDAEQRIYAWRKGVSETRLRDFSNTLRVTTIDFQDENNRSPTTGIAGYARSLLSPTLRVDLPDDIVCKNFPPGRFEIGLRFALLDTLNQTAKRAKRRDISVAVAARSKDMVRLISDALSQSLVVNDKVYKSFHHDVMFDEVRTSLAARVIAFILGSEGIPQSNRIAGILERMSAFYRSAGNKTSIKKSDQLLKWADKCLSGKPPKTKCVEALDELLRKLDTQGFVGAPTEDWIEVRRSLENADVADLNQTGDHARYLRLLRRGSAIDDGLASLWSTNGNYTGSEATLDAAIIQDQMLDSHLESSGVTVMTMHQLKGREYDAVLLVEDMYRTFRGKENQPPFMETRRLLQVSLTRARYFAYVLSAVGNTTLVAIMVE